MPDARFAQKLLALVTQPERAESAVGDLVEQAESRGEVWFWRSVIRMTAAHAMTAESRKQWTLLPALLDSTVTAVLFHFFALGGWRGIPILFVSGMLWAYLSSAVFTGSRPNDHRKLRTSWILVCFLAFWMWSR